MSEKTYKLAEKIIKLSEHNSWELAKLEWKLREIYFSNFEDTCLCGHYPIKEICVIENRLNKNTAEIGNCCVKKFLGLNPDKIFQCLKRIVKDKSKGLNQETIEYCYEKKWINDWEYDFSIDTSRKINLTFNQVHYRERINIKILKKILKY